MKDIRIDKVTLNIGTGKDQARLENGIKLIKHITGIKGVSTVTKKRIPEWGLRPGLTVGCRLTLRDEAAIKLLKSLLGAIENKMTEKQFNDRGNIAFGIKEYIDIPGVKYSPDISLMGLSVCITLKRAGFRVKERRITKKKIGKKHLITKEEAIEFMDKKFNVKVGDKE